MWEQDIKTLCKKLKPLLGKRADALWTAYVTAETPRSKQETEALIQLLATQYLSAHVSDDPILLPPPSDEDAAGEFLLGSICYGRTPLKPLYLRRDNFIRHLGIFATTGAGKTNVAQLLLLGLLNKNIPFLVVDWKRSYHLLRSVPVEKAKDILVYSVGRKGHEPFHWNPLRGPPGVHPKTWISAVAEALEKSHLSGPGVADILIEALDKQFEAFGFYDGEHDQYPNFFDAAAALDRVQFKGRRMLWQDSCLRILRTFTFGPTAGAFNARHPLELETLLNRPVIIELDQELPKPLRVFLSDIILRWIHLYRLSQGETEQLRHVIFLEEVHNLFPRSQAEHQATNSLENVFREIRGFGEGLVSITQHPSLIPIYILGNCNTQIYLGLQHEEDIFTARRSLFLEKGEEVYLDRLKVGEGIVKIKGRTGPCLVKFPLVPIRRGETQSEPTENGGKDGKARLD
jgi:DNA helicase HerA-like ATPase